MNRHNLIPGIPILESPAVPQVIIEKLVVVGVIILSFGIASFATYSQSIRLLSILVGAVFLLFFVKWPEWGVLALIPTALVVPFVIDTGTQTRLIAGILLVILLSCLWVFRLLVNRRDSLIVLSKPLLPLLALIIVAAFSFGLGQLPWFPFARQATILAQLGGLTIFVISASVFILVSNQFQAIKWLEYATWIFLVIGGAYMFGRIFPSLINISLLPRGAAGGMFWTWMVALSLSQAIFNEKMNLRWRLLLAVLTAATLYTGWFQSRDWASGWIPPFVSVFVLLWLRSWRLGLLVMAIGILAKLIFFPGLADDLLAADEYSIITRWAAWSILFKEIIAVSPLFGLGPSNYYHYTSQFPILGWYVEFSSHNQYVDLLAQVGILGLFCFLMFAWESGKLAWRLRGQLAPSFSFAYSCGAIAGLAGSLVSGMLGDWILPFVYNLGMNEMRASIFFWYFLGGLVVIDQSLSREKVSFSG